MAVIMRSGESHVGGLGGVPGGHLGGLLELDELAEAGLHDHALLLALVQQLLLPAGQGLVVRTTRLYRINIAYSMNDPHGNILT